MATARLAALRARIKGKEEEAQAKRGQHFALATSSQPVSVPTREQPQKPGGKSLTPEQEAAAKEKAQRRTDLLKKLKAQDELADIVRRAQPPQSFEEEPPAKRLCSEAPGEEVLEPEPAPQATEARCKCGLPPAEFTVRKEGPNQGRAFLKCQEGRCSFWEWADEGRPQGTSSAAGGAGQPPAGVAPSSGSSVLGLGFSGPLATAFAAGRASGTEASTPPARPPGRSTGFFESETPPPAPAPGSRVCGCGVGAVTFKATKEGANQGRRFWKCSEQRCKYFEWDDEAPKPAPAPGAGGGGAGTCFRCGKTGHFSRDCQEKPQAASTGCFRCGQGGHFARDCPTLAAPA